MKNTINISIKVVIMMSVLVLTTSCMGDQKQKTTQVSWVTHYKTIEEMISKSDYIAIASVEDQNFEVRVDMVFTMSRLKIQTLMKSPDDGSVSTFTLLQTGGTKDGITTYPIEDVLMVKPGHAYLFFLEKTEEGHVLLMGGYQGIASIKSGKVIFPDNRAFIVNDLDRLSIQAVQERILNLLKP